MAKSNETIPLVSTKSVISTWLVVLIIIVMMIISAFALSIGWFMGTYNTLVVAKEDVHTQWGNVKTEYQRRADLLYNMAETAKGYATFEEETMTAIAKARGGSFGASKADEMAAMNSMDTLLSRMMTRLEQYPELKTIAMYGQLMNELQNTENSIRLSRVSYNSVVRSYNIYLKKFPNNFIATAFGFESEQFYDSEVQANTAPKLDMTR